MADTPNCTVCKKFIFSFRKCSIYQDEIPLDIFVELKECPHFEIAQNEEIDDDLPIAKGR